jgi:hypothetical protein
LEGCPDVPGTGPSPYSLILLGDDMYLFEREEYDAVQTWPYRAPLARVIRSPRRVIGDHQSSSARGDATSP